jgi:ribosomal protein S18 acetylase RimI-like enzyme
MIAVQAATESLIPSYYETLRLVAQERVYLEMTEPPPLEQVIGFQMSLIAQRGPIVYAVKDEDHVVGWCDVFPFESPRHAHRGSLGMGILPEYRGDGLGSRMLEATLKQAKVFGLEKVELCVYTTNHPAISMYEKFRFQREGIIKKYRKLDGVYYDALNMGLFL